ncbi:MAG: hypothetical protein R3222_10000 [Balneolaceae bacterium]|nr:hypothetical protein [Balneolaceae bacterium]
MSTNLNAHTLTSKCLFGLILTLLVFSLATNSVIAQSSESMEQAQQIKPLRTDVGILGLTANFKWLNDFTYMGNKVLESDDNTTELEIEFRDVRTMSPRAAIGFQVLTSFYAGGSELGVGSWGLGPVLRAHPLAYQLERWQPYVQADALFGNNMALGELADTRNGGDGFRVRLGLRGGLAYRFTNEFGVFVEAGPDWEGSRFFKADARAWQLNFGIDLYRFN